MSGSAPFAARFTFGVVEPSLCDAVRRTATSADGDPGDEYWSAFLKCFCGAAAGQRCWAVNGRVVGGQPDGVRVLLPRAHGSRRTRKGVPRPVL